MRRPHRAGRASTPRAFGSATTMWTAPEGSPCVTRQAAPHRRGQCLLRLAGRLVGGRTRRADPGPRWLARATSDLGPDQGVPADPLSVYDVLKQLSLGSPMSRDITRAPPTGRYSNSLNVESNQFTALTRQLADREFVQTLYSLVEGGATPRRSGTSVRPVSMLRLPQSQLSVPGKRDDLHR